VLSILSVELFAYQNQQSNQLTDLNIHLSRQSSFEAWQYDKALSLQWRPIFNNPDDSLNHSYRFGNDLVQLDIAYFRFQREGSEAISGQNKLTDPYDGEWKILSSTDFKSQDHYVSETTVQRNSQKLLIWHWYRIGQHQTPNAYIAKGFEAYNRIFLGRKDAALISIATHFEESKEVSRSRLREFWQAASKNVVTDLETIATKQ
jgi:EpsI family protein